MKSAFLVAISIFYCILFPQRKDTKKRYKKKIIAKKDTTSYILWEGKKRYEKRIDGCYLYLFFAKKRYKKRDEKKIIATKIFHIKILKCEGYSYPSCEAFCW